MRNHILFVHIPKTAGTSFRKAAETYFGVENTLYDYSLNSEETSDIIVKNIYREHDFYALGQQMEPKEKLFLSGHFHVFKYMHLFDTLNVITFVREPVAQVLSHYRHFVTYHGYKKSLEDFVLEERFQNIQFKFLQAKPLELFGFVGITEEYAMSIKMLNRYYGIELNILEMNAAKGDMPEMDEALKSLIQEHNQKDILLYKKAKAIFADRLASFQKNEPYTHMFIQEKNEEGVRGVALQKNCNDVLTVMVDFYGKKVKAEAKNLRPGLLVHNLPRNGYVGFDYREER